MGAAMMIARIRLRRRWRSLVVIGLLIAVAGGVVLTAIAGARRTATALDRLRSETRAADVGIDLFDGRDDAFAARVGRLPGVVDYAQMEVWAAGVLDRRAEIPIVAAVDGRFGRAVDRSILVRGRRAHTAHEVVVPENLARRQRFEVGAHLHIATYDPNQLDELRNSSTARSQPSPKGPTITLRVVGIDRRAGDLTSQGQQTGIMYLGAPTYRAYRHQVLSFTAIVRVRVAPGAAHGLASRVRAFAGDRHLDFESGGLDVGGVDDSVSVLGTGLLLFAAIAALGALVTLTILLARWSAAALEDQPTEYALGLTTRRRAAAILLPTVPAIVGGALAAVGIAVIASRFMPTGIAREVEPSPGVDVDPLVLALGFTTLVILVTTAGALISWQLARRRRWNGASGQSSVRVSRAASAVARLALPVPAVIGSGMALDRGRGTATAPGRPVIAVTAFAVTGIVAMLVAGASLDRMLNEPSRYAYEYDTIVVGGGGLSRNDNACGHRTSTLTALPQIAAIASICSGAVTVAGRPLGATGIVKMRGTIRPTILRGRAPVRSTEIALGEKTLAALGRSIGDHVVVRGSDSSVKAQVVGSTFFPTPNDHDTVTLADGVLMRADALARLTKGSFPQVVIRWRPGIDRASAIAEVTRISGAPPIAPVRPPELDRLAQIDRLPLVLAAFLAVLALVGLAHGVATNAFRRRRNLALLRTIGFRSRQLAATIASHAVALVISGLVIGIPLGIVVGRLAWASISDGLGIAPDASIPLVELAVVVIASIGAALVLAVVPARATARIRPAVALRGE